MKTNALTAVKENHFANLQNILKQTEKRELSNTELREALQQSLDLLKTMEPNPENILLKKILWKSINDLYRLTIVNQSNFVSDYFQNLPEFETSKECFENLNNYYFKSFGEYKYENFKAFKTALGMS